MATKTIERWQDGVLISTEEVEVEDDPEETVTIPKTAVDEFVDTLSDPSVNSIVELKEALSKLMERVQG